MLIRILILHLCKIGAYCPVVLSYLVRPMYQLNSNEQNIYAKQCHWLSLNEWLHWPVWESYWGEGICLLISILIQVWERSIICIFSKNLIFSSHHVYKITHFPHTKFSKSRILYLWSLLFHQDIYANFALKGMQFSCKHVAMFTYGYFKHITWFWHWSPFSCVK